jgi:hypothetical protein
MRLAIWTSALILIGIQLLGCGSNKPNEGKVSGQVTFDGQPLKTGSITFVPADGRTATAGGSIADGKYEVQSFIGDTRVQISAPKVVGKHKQYEEMPNSPVLDTIVELLPLRYNTQTELTYTVTAGSQSKDFELKSK